MKKLFTAALILISSSFLKGQSYISGTISDSTGAAANVGVALFSFNNLSIVDTLLSLDGSYQFNNVDTGQYLVVARGNKLQYPNHIVTYYGQHTKWSAGTIITVQDTNNFPNTDIILIQKPDWSNSDNKGFCSGRIKIGQGLRAGDPIPGIDIALEQIPGGIIKASTTTDSTGLFKIEKIPDNTEYQLIVDIPGYPIDSTHTVKILNSDSVMNLDFVVDTAAGSEGIFVSQEVLTSFYAFSPKIFNDIKIFPNPSDGLFFVELISTGNDVTIYDVQGRPILNKTINTNIARIDLTNYPKGIYVIEIKNKFGIENHKILVK